MRAGFTILFAFSILAACGNNEGGKTTLGSGGMSTTTTGTGATTSGAGGGSAGGGSAGGGQGQGGSGYDPPPVPVACTAPIITPGATWMAAAGERFFPVRLAWTGSEAAIAYAESTMADAWDVKPQRLSKDGATLRKPIALGSSSGNFGPTLSI